MLQVFSWLPAGTSQLLTSCHPPCSNMSKSAYDVVSFLLLQVNLRRRVNFLPRVNLRRPCQHPASSPSRPTTSCHSPSPSQPATSCQPPTPSPAYDVVLPSCSKSACDVGSIPAPSQLATPSPPAVISQPPHTSQLNPGESLSRPSINLCPQILPVLHAPSILPTPPPHPLGAGGAAAAVSMHSDVPFSGTANRDDDAYTAVGCACDELGRTGSECERQDLEWEVWNWGFSYGKMRGLGVISQAFCSTSAGSSFFLQSQISWRAAHKFVCIKIMYQYYVGKKKRGEKGAVG